MYKSKNTNTTNYVLNIDKFKDDCRDISIVKRQKWLQNQIPWTTVIKKDKKWRKSSNRTFRPVEKVKYEIDPYKFQSIPKDIHHILKQKRKDLGLSLQNLSYKSNIYIDKLLEFENRDNLYRLNNYLSNYELYKINYIINNYNSIKDIKNLKIPKPEGMLSSLSEF
tara:strand:- start:945 stop:1442 length:498 start_codon:yes stop_codon:yes gene_type:complete